MASLQRRPRTRPAPPVGPPRRSSRNYTKTPAPLKSGSRLRSGRLEAIPVRTTQLEKTFEEVEFAEDALMRDPSPKTPSFVESPEVPPGGPAAEEPSERPALESDDEEEGVALSLAGCPPPLIVPLDAIPLEDDDSSVLSEDVDPTPEDPLPTSPQSQPLLPTQPAQTLVPDASLSHLAAKTPSALPLSAERHHVLDTNNLPQRPSPLLPIRAFLSQQVVKYDNLILQL